MNTTVLAAGTAPNVTSRVVALVSASVFDAVNGIDPRFRPIHVRPNAPRNASQRAAAIQAAYAILFNLYPSATLTARRDASLAALASTKSGSHRGGCRLGAKRLPMLFGPCGLTDGFAPTPPPFLGVLGIVGTPGAVGAWRPTPQGLPDQTARQPGRNTADRHHDPVGTHAAIAVPLAAAPGLSTARSTLTISTK